MATTVTKIVDPGTGAGYDYDSRLDWEAAQQGDLTGVRNEIAVASCRATNGTTDGDGCVIDGWTLSETQYVKVTTDPNHRHAGAWDSAKARCTTTNPATPSIVVAEQNVIIEWQQFEHAVASNNQAVSLSIENTKVTVRNCIFRRTVTGYTSWFALLYTWAAAGDTEAHYVYRNLFYDLTDGSSDGGGLYIDSYNGTQTEYVYNNTFFNCRNGLYCGGGINNFYLKNNFSGSCSIACFTIGTVNTLFDYSKNISSDATSPDGASYRNKTDYANYFVDYANKNFHLKATDTVLKDAGDNLGSPYDIDIDGQTVSAPWDIGADEYQAASAPLEQEGFRFRNDDGSESGATWKASQDTDINLAADTAARLRFLINATGDPAGKQFQLEFRHKPSGGSFGPWKRVLNAQ